MVQADAGADLFVFWAFILPPIVRSVAMGFFALEQTTEIYFAISSGSPAIAMRSLRFAPQSDVEPRREGGPRRSKPGRVAFV